MDPLLTSIGLYVGEQLVDQAIVDTGYNPIRKWLFPKKKYKHRLTQLIYQTMIEYERKYPWTNDSGKIPFYRTRILFEKLSTQIFFKNLPLDGITKEFESNLNIIPPTSEQLNEFFQLFISKVNADKELKKLHVQENVELEIFEIVSGIKGVVKKLELMHSDIRDLKEGMVKREAEILNESYLKDLEYPTKLLENYKPRQALEFLLSLKENKWENANPLFKYKVLANTGMCYVQLYDYDNAAKFLIESENYNPKTAVSQGFFALGYALKGDVEGFERVYKRAKEIGDIVESVYSSMIMLDEGKSNIQDLLEKIPQELWERSQIAFMISRHLRKQNDVEGAIKWGEIAIKNDDKKPYELKGILGSTILEMITDPLQLVTKQIATETIRSIYKAIDLLTESWEEISTHEMKEIKYHLLLNRGVAKKIIGDFEGAYIDIKAASNYNKQLVTLRHLAIVCVDLRKFDESIEVFQKIIAESDPSEDVDTIKLLLADIYSLAMRKDEAILTLKETISTAISGEHEIESRSLLCRIYLEDKDLDKAKEILSESIEKFPESIELLMDHAQFDYLDNNTFGVKQKMEKVLELAELERDFQIIYRTAQSCFELGYFSDAIKMYERLADKNKYSKLSNRIVESYIHLNQDEDALLICQNIRSAGHLDRSLIQQELNIYRKISGIDQALGVCEEFLNLYPNDPAINAQAATFSFKRRNIPKTIEYLQKIESLDGFRIEAAAMIIRIYIAVGLYKEGFELLYNLRRSNFDSSAIHGLYINVILHTPPTQQHLLEASTVDVGTAVAIENESGTLTSYVIVSASESKIEIDELRANSSLGSKLIGKIEGDVVELSQNFGIVDRVTIRKVSSKYDYAREKSFELLETTFSAETDFKILKAKGDTEEERTQSIIQLINSQATDKQKRNEELQKLYNDGVLTIGHYADLQTSTEIEAWTSLTNLPEMGINAIQMGSIEFEKCLLWFDEKKNVVLDITTLLTLHSLEALHVLEKYSGEKLVGQNLIDCFLKFIDHNEGLGANGSMSVTKSGGQFYRQEITKEQVQNNVSIVKKLLEWVNNNCRCVPCNEYLKLSPDLRDKIYEMLGEISAEAILLAKEHDALLFAEEILIRSVAFGEHSLISITTQEFLRINRDNKDVSQKDYDLYTAKLLSLNYRGLRIEPSQLMVALEESKYQITIPFTNAARILVDSEEDSTMFVVIKFFRILYLNVSVKEQRDKVIIHLLNTITERRDKRIVAIKILYPIDVEFHLLPNQKLDLKNLIRSWIRAQKII